MPGVRLPVKADSKFVKGKVTVDADSFGEVGLILSGGPMTFEEGELVIKVDQPGGLEKVEMLIKVGSMEANGGAPDELSKKGKPRGRKQKAGSARRG